MILEIVVPQSGERGKSLVRIHVICCVNAYILCKLTVQKQLIIKTKTLLTCFSATAEA